VNVPKSRRRLAPSEKYEVFVSVLTGQATQREAAAKWKVDRSTVVHICCTARQGALDALSASVPGRPGMTAQQAELVAEGEQGGDGARGVGRDVVAAGPGGLDGKALAAEFAQVVGGLPDRVAGLAGHGGDLGGVLGDGEAVRGGGQGQHGSEGGPDAGLVQIDAAVSVTAHCPGPQPAIRR